MFAAGACAFVAAPLIARAAGDASAGMRAGAAAHDRADLTLRLSQARPASQFGKAGSWWLSTGSGAAFAGRDNNVGYNAFVGFSAFLVDDVELNLELAGWYFDQQGDDAGAGNFNLVFKWHFLDEGDWSLFVDAGAGVILSTDEVPPGGTGFNFTPRAGLGATFRLGDSPNRLLIGARWQHISNARIEGDDSNPGRDSAMVYAGVMFPF